MTDANANPSITEPTAALTPAFAPEAEAQGESKPKKRRAPRAKTTAKKPAAKKSATKKAAAKPRAAKPRATKPRTTAKSKTAAKPRAAAKTKKTAGKPKSTTTRTRAAKPRTTRARSKAPATGISAAAIEGAATTPAAEQQTTTATNPLTPRAKSAKVPRMAKSTEKMARAPKKTVSKAIPKSRSSKTTKPASPGLVPLFDTALVAQNAAAMLIHHDIAEQVEEHNAQHPADPKHESSTFKNLKEQLAHPKPAALSHLLGGIGNQKKSTGGLNSFNQQKGHNQTSGGFNKAGVPRRTNG